MEGDGSPVGTSHPTRIAKSKAIVVTDHQPAREAYIAKIVIEKTALANWGFRLMVARRKIHLFLQVEESDV
jgi:hypothetical protein